MKAVNRNQTPESEERVMREMWLFTAGTRPGIVDQKLSKAWTIHEGDIVTKEDYQRLSLEILDHYRLAKEANHVRWARLEWNGFDPLPYGGVFGNGNERHAG